VNESVVLSQNGILCLCDSCTLSTHATTFYFVFKPSL